MNMLADDSCGVTLKVFKLGKKSRKEYMEKKMRRMKMSWDEMMKRCGCK